MLWMIVYGIGVCGAFIASVKRFNFVEIVASLVFALLWPFLFVAMLFKKIGF